MALKRLKLWLADHLFLFSFWLLNVTCQSITSHAISNLTGHSWVFTFLLPNFFCLIFSYQHPNIRLQSVFSRKNSCGWNFPKNFLFFLKIWINYWSSLSIIGNKNVCVLKIKSDALVKIKLIYYMRIFEVLLIFQIKRLRTVCAHPHHRGRIRYAITFQNNFITSAVMYRSDWKAHLEKGQNRNQNNQVLYVIPMRLSSWVL